MATQQTTRETRKAHLGIYLTKDGYLAQGQDAKGANVKTTWTLEQANRILEKFVPNPAPFRSHLNDTQIWNNGRRETAKSFETTVEGTLPAKHTTWTISLTLPAVAGLFFGFEKRVSDSRLSSTELDLDAELGEQEEEIESEMPA
jgi:hypothetical protein